jgi:hypothetical protein
VGSRSAPVGTPPDLRSTNKIRRIAETIKGPGSELIHRHAKGRSSSLARSAEGLGVMSPIGARSRRAEPSQECLVLVVNRT